MQEALNLLIYATKRVNLAKCVILAHFCCLFMFCFAVSLMQKSRNDTTLTKYFYFEAPFKGYFYFSLYSLTKQLGPRALTTPPGMILPTTVGSGCFKHGSKTSDWTRYVEYGSLLNILSLPIQFAGSGAKFPDLIIDVKANFNKGCIYCYFGNIVPLVGGNFLFSFCQSCNTLGKLGKTFLTTLFGCNLLPE